MATWALHRHGRRDRPERRVQGTRLTVIGRNLTDEIYIQRSNSDVSGRLGAPRSFEIQLTRVF